MSRAYNFSAGPATLPETVLQQARDEMLDWHGVGASIVELSHRGPEFMQVAAEAEADLRTLLSVPDDYAVLFLAGGATTQQALLALNFAAPGQPGPSARGRLVDAAGEDRRLRMPARAWGFQHEPEVRI